MNLTGSREEATVAGNEAFPVNKGALCIKGWTSTETLAHPDRLLTPLARNPEGELQPVTWDEALSRTVSAFQSAQAQYGRDAVGAFLAAAP
jgi:assimilatory nitrate reductase catalytic subunit